MKNIQNIVNYLTRGMIIVAVTGLAFAFNSAVAQEKAAERLTKSQRVSASADVKAVVAGDTMAMSCPKCKDSMVKVAQPMGKAGKQETASVKHHDCPACSAKTVSGGMGKQAQSTVTHTCKMGVSAASGCCAMKK